MIALRPHRLLVSAFAVIGALLAFAAPAHAQNRYGPEAGYLGYSFLRVPDVNGDWRGQQHRNWVRIEGHYWPGQYSGDTNAGIRITSSFPVPGAPRSGEGRLVLSIRKDSPALPALMQRCQSGASMDEVGYAVSADRSNRIGLRVQRPANVPEFFEFTLRNVRFVDCPVVEGAPEQAIVVQFGDINWTNWSDADARTIPITLEPAQLMPLPRNLSGETRAWVLTWFALANDVSADQCPNMNLKPVEEDYYRLVPPQEAAEERARLAGEGGVGYENNQMALRGPHHLNAALLPGIVPDPGQHEPQTTIARGVNLDGSTRGHRNYTSEDGRTTGIDNQLYTVMGCNAGWSGHTGFLFQYMMEQMRNGQLSILVQVDGIDNERNDREVYVTMLYSTDDMAKNSSGSAILPDYTFRPTTDPQYAHYVERVRGRIVDGVIVTDPVDHFDFNIARLGGPLPPGTGLSDARLRLELRPDRSLHGVLAGYADWREIPTMNGLAIGEFSFGYQQPALYNSLRRNADGRRNPVTGENDGISAVYDLEGVPAFVASPTPNIASAEQTPRGGS